MYFIDIILAQILLNQCLNNFFKPKEPLMSLLKIIMTLSLCAFTQVSFADINDRINDCERSGGGSCVYNILRELASSSGGNSNSYCECRTSRYDRPSYTHYSDVFKVIVLPNGTEKVQQLTRDYSSCYSGSPTLGCDSISPCKERLRLNPISGC